MKKCLSLAFSVALCLFLCLVCASCDHPTEGQDTSTDGIPTTDQVPAVCPVPPYIFNLPTENESFRAFLTAAIGTKEEYTQYMAENLQMMTFGVPYDNPKSVFANVAPLTIPLPKEDATCEDLSATYEVHFRENGKGYVDQEDLFTVSYTVSGIKYDFTYNFTRLEPPVPDREPVITDVPFGPCVLDFYQMTDRLYGYALHKDYSLQLDVYGLNDPADFSFDCFVLGEITDFGRTDGHPSEEQPTSAPTSPSEEQPSEPSQEQPARAPQEAGDGTPRPTQPSKSRDAVEEQPSEPSQEQPTRTPQETVGGTPRPTQPGEEKPTVMDDGWIIVDTPTTVTDSSGLVFMQEGDSYTVTDYLGTSDTLTIPAIYEGLPVKKIRFSALDHSESLVSISIPASIEEIGDNAFYNCQSLSEVHFEENSQLRGIGHQAFAFCRALQKITLPEGLRSIGDYAFNLSALTSLHIPKNVTDIGKGIFSECFSFERITVDADNEAYQSNGNCLIDRRSKTLILGLYNTVIPSDGSVTSIAENAFYNQNKLESLTLPATVTKIGKRAFAACHLSSIQVESGNPVYESKNNCLIEKATKTLILGSTQSVIPSDGSVTAIGDYAFESTLISNIGIPVSITSIGEGAFDLCDTLYSIHYEGTKAQWEQITIAYGNYLLELATLYTNVPMP